MNHKQIYMDYQSAKPVDPEVINVMNEFQLNHWGNPSSLHKIGDFATDSLESSRQTIADWINCKKKEIIFTGSATESINLALIGFALRNKRKGNHIIISEVEHISIHNIAKYLERNGFQVSKVPVDQYGRIMLKKLRSRIKKETILISVQMANNEIGTIQPTKEIGEIAKEKGIAFYTDAVAAEGNIPIDVKENNINLMTLSSNDIYGPKGLGVFYMQDGFRVKPIMIGGGQERGFRSGSENMPAIIGMKKAVEILNQKMDTEVERMKSFQKLFIREILESNPDTYLNGHPKNRLANNSHFRFDGIEGESILLSFKDKNIAVSTGSACSSKTLEPSHTLIATGLLHEEAHGSLELTTGRFTTMDEVKKVINEVPAIVKRLRDLSPLYKK